MRVQPSSSGSRRCYIGTRPDFRAGAVSSIIRQSPLSSALAPGRRLRALAARPGQLSTLPGCSSLGSCSRSTCAESAHLPPYPQFTCWNRHPHSQETMFYYQLQRTPACGRLPTSDRQIDTTGTPRWLMPVPQGSAARVWAYRRTVWVHLLCVHVLASALSNAMLFFGLQSWDGW